ncbi:MAG: nitronate monooxygenase, partial [Chloroflexi bacterium]|nr:nitronate monooxygenase [Chloroflexota bacterium]
MLHTRICDLLGVDHPIISAPMANAAGAELAAAVSEAGGFGMIGGSSGNDPGWLRDQIRLVRERTDRPFGVGFISSRPGQESLFQVALEEQVVAICYSFADLTPYVPAAHEAGVKVVAQVQKVSHARIAALAGVDIIVAQGSEAGGHTGYNGTLPMVPSVIDVAGGIPVVAAGGIADGRGLASVLMLGAEGAVIGSRFVASVESVKEDWEKEAIVAAGADDTILTKVYDLTSGAAFPRDVGDRVLHKFLDGRDDPLKALDAPDVKFVSLGYGGTLIVRLETPYYAGKNGEAVVIETTFGAPDYPTEKANVSVSGDAAGPWVFIGVAFNDVP